MGATRLTRCRAASPPSLLRLASRTDCRKVHAATSGLHLHLIFIPHLAVSSSSSSSSIHRPFSSLQSPLLFPICAFSPEERTSWITVPRHLQVQGITEPACSSTPHTLCGPQAIRLKTVPPSHHACSLLFRYLLNANSFLFDLPVWACQNYFICFLQLRLELFPDSSNTIISWSSIYMAVSLNWIPSNQHLLLP